MSRILALLLFVNANVFGQAAAGNEKYDQKQYADAVNAFEKVPPAERDAGILNRLGISYHLLKQFKAAENAYRAAVSKRSEEHTSELQSHHDLVCRLLLEKKK